AQSNLPEQRDTRFREFLKAKFGMFFYFNMFTLNRPPAKRNVAKRNGKTQRERERIDRIPAKKSPASDQRQGTLQVVTQAPWPTLDHLI
ncbi:MAG: hypothetical protein WCJ99_18400, partial [Betaproteobacteria bacterium]